MGQDENEGEDDYTLADAAAAATRMLKHGVSDAEIKDLLPEHYREDAFELARLRKRASERFEDPWDLWFDEQGLRYATPDVVAKARASRLAAFGSVAVDPACGVGIQLGFMAGTFEQAAGAEIDPETIALARRNLQALGVKAQIVQGDCLEADTQAQLPAPDVLICDPAREAEADERTLEGLAPDLREVHKAYADTAAAWCYELPPMIDPELLSEHFTGELEYTSLNLDLNRLALYGGEAQQANRSALALPSGERLDDRDPSMTIEHVEEPGAIIHRADRTVVQADLLGQLAHRLGTSRLLSDEHPRRFLFTSEQASSTAFTEDYRVLDTHTWNLMGLREKLKRLGAGHVTLRTSIDPDRYWNVRNALEEGLEGDRRVQLFRREDTGIIVEPIETESPR